MPVYFFALSQVNNIHQLNAILLFIILHLLVYPSSNGYNSYMDRDTGPVGGISKPLQPTRQLFYATILMDLAAIIVAAFIGMEIVLAILAYILASRAYSYRKIRLKQYALIGYLIVIIFQGAVCFYIVFMGSDEYDSSQIPYTAMVASSFLVGSFYPLTQIYQHEADRKDNVSTISSKLGYRGTFIFSAIIFTIAQAILLFYFSGRNEIQNFYVIITVLLPATIFFIYWWALVWKNTVNANFKNTMRMNVLASACTNVAFLILLIRNHQ